MGYMKMPGALPEPSPDVTPSLQGEQTRSQHGRGFVRTNWSEKYAPGCGQFGFPVSVGDGVFNYSRGGKFLSPPRRRYSTYRIMDLNPSMKLARKMLAWRILSSSWTYKGIDKDTPATWLKMIKDQCDRLRYGFLDQGIRYTSFGWRPFEQVWAYKDGYHWLKGLKALAPDLTDVLIDDGGNFVGLYQAMDKVTLRVDRYAAFKVTHDGDAGNHYGESRHESAYDSWIHWQQTRLDQLRLSDKLAGVIPILKFPPGKSNINGTLTDNSEIAQVMLDDLAAASGIAFQANEWARDELRRNPELSKISDWNIDFYDAGNLAPAQMGMIATAEYDDKLMLRAWETPERSATESTAGGSKADSSVHTDSAVSAVERDDADLARQFTAGPVNNLLLLNVGENAVDKVVVAASPLVERKRVAAAAFLKLLLVDPVIRSAAMRCVDANQLIDLVEIPRSGNFELTAEELARVGQDNTLNSGSSNPTGAAITTGATNKSVVGRVRGVVQASLKDIKDDIAEIYEFLRTPEEEVISAAA